MPERVIMSQDQIRRALVRIAHEAVEANDGCRDLVLIGIHTRGVPLAHRIADAIADIERVRVPVGALDIGLHRDDISYKGARPVLQPNHMPTDITDMVVVLVDDVLFTGRSVRAAMDALVDLGRPRRIMLAVLIDRGHRELPIKANFVGKNIPSYRPERIQLRLRETDGVDEVVVMDGAEAAVQMRGG